ncbi:ubiquinol-cytochrome c reductase iron-sulfur subunit [Propionivibrio sp.]|uniref:ubiquinol-cytochrome c reductase iron-sulfur subunit n=1 Tax=Propionivibrio sp. TaxID=2212460 RepID=UPI003BEFEBB0
MSTYLFGNPERRRLHLVAALCVLGTGLGAVSYLAGRSQAPAGNPTPVDFADLPPGKLRTVDWMGRTVWVLRRSADEVAALADRESELIDPHSRQSLQPEGCHNRHRSLRPDIFVAIGQCTHQGCQPQLRAGLGVHGEFLCPCHTSKFDLAGRVFSKGPAPSNLVIPEYRLESDTRLVIGEV